LPSPPALWAQARARWALLLASPEGGTRIARGVAAGAAAAMLPAFGLHLVFAGAFALVLRGSLPVAAGICLGLGNPLTHLFLLPAEFALGRALLPPGADILPSHGPAWLMAALPAAEETALGGAIFALVAGALGWWAARRALVAAERRNAVRHRQGNLPPGPLPGG
jgi:uncharacterized protein (DUF2062 family)